LKKGASGIFHIGGREFVSRYEFACRISDYFAMRTTLVLPIESDSLARLAARPKIAGLNCQETERYLQVSMPDLSDEFARIKKEQQPTDS
jgi:dTDP-4-dehydrorhamnose reductase